MTGDGELQEGQNWEALQSAAHGRLGRLWVIVDRNELQSDKTTEEILALGDLEAKLRAFGWHVATCDGHDHAALRETFASFDAGPEDVPKALVAQHDQGQGRLLHGAPPCARGGRRHLPLARGRAGRRRLRARPRRARGADRGAARAAGARPRAAAARRAPASLEGEPESGIAARPKVTDEYVAAAYGEALVELAGRVPELVVLDADLSSDCRIRGFEDAHPDRFLESGIAEQDMVSAAAGLARHGLLPVVNSFASFLASRANEQIYNQASERTKVVYALHYAGLIPAGPGKSHQSIRDVSLLAALPEMTIVHPASAAETRALTAWAVEEAEGSVAIRLAIGPSPRRLELGGEVAVGRGTILREGTDALLFAYGPVMLHEALTAAEASARVLQVVALPWLNRVDHDWLAETVAPFADVFVLEDHAPVGALGDTLLRELAAAGLLEGRALHVFGVEGWPACGTPPEALRAHRLDGASLAERIEAVLRAPATP